MTSTIHTGSGRDLVFVNNMHRSAIDFCNGQSGRTDVICPNDKGDMLIADGNWMDNRVFVGVVDYIFIWYVDNNEPDSWLTGGSFCGTGGYADALLENDKDRLILVIPDDTPVVGDEKGSVFRGYNKSLAEKSISCKYC